MSEENKAIIYRLLEGFWVKGDLNVADELLATNFTYHSGAEKPLDLEGYKKAMLEYPDYCNDVQATVEDIVAEGDKVAVRYTWTGIHTGGLLGAPPTEKRLILKMIAILRIVDGKIVDEWDTYDSLGMYQQLGLLPVE